MKYILWVFLSSFSVIFSMHQPSKPRGDAGVTVDIEGYQRDVQQEERPILGVRATIKKKTRRRCNGGLTIVTGAAVATVGVVPMYLGQGNIDLDAVLAGLLMAGGGLVSLTGLGYVAKGIFDIARND